MATIASSHVDRPAPDRLRPVRIWLYCIAALTLVMVAVGGITRLTGSGLSITEWAPISGILPPLTQADWEAQFEAYKQIPQYQLQNYGMSLAEFEYIFWWEWAHRFLGRVIGIAFAVPFVIFLFQRRFSWKLATPLAILFVLGGLQGVLGWWMVSSGLSERVDVSQYRLVAHLTAAAFLFSALIFVARRLENQPRNPDVGSRWPGFWLLVLLVVQIAAGAFVAGLDAGMTHNTWPLMDDRIIPRGMTELEPLWRNLFENHTTVQFIHRGIAYLIVIYAAVLIWQHRKGGFAGIDGWLPRIGLLVLLQVIIGIATLLNAVPISLALGHQALAFMLAGVVTAWIADIWNAKRGSLLSLR